MRTLYRHDRALQPSLPRSVRVRSLDLDHQRRRWMIVQGSVAMPARPMWLPRADLRRPRWRVHVAVTSSPSSLQVRLYAPRRFKSMCTSRTQTARQRRLVLDGAAQVAAFVQGQQWSTHDPHLFLSATLRIVMR